jgi:hypothetical protein
MERFKWEWHCVWYDEDGELIDRDYASLGGNLERFTKHTLGGDYYMEFGLTLHWNCDGDWTDIVQERADIDKNLEFDLTELSRDIPKYILKEFEQYKHKLKPQGKCPWS